MSDQSDTLALAAAPLTVQERQFVEHLTSDPEFRLANAARAVGFLDNPGKAAERMLKRGPVLKYLAAIQADQRDRLRDIRDSVIQSLWQLAAGWDLAGLVEEVEIAGENGEVRHEIVTIPPNRLPPALRAAIKGVKRDKFGHFEYQFVDRAAILALLLKHFGESEKGKLPGNDAPEVAKTTVEYPE